MAEKLLKESLSLEQQEKLLRAAMRSDVIYRKSKMSGQGAYVRLGHDDSAAFVAALTEDRELFGDGDDDNDLLETIFKHHRDDQEEALRKMEKIVSGYREFIEGEL